MTDRPSLEWLLGDAVSDVDPDPALDRIRDQTRQKVSPMTSKRPWILVATGAVAATAATLVVVSVVGDDPVRPDGSAPAASGSPDLPVATPTESESGSDPDPSPTEAGETGPEPVRVPVYFRSNTPRGPFLAREFQDVPAPADPTDADRVEAAVGRALAGAALDPDYSSAWAGLDASVGSVEIASGSASLDLRGPADLAQAPAGLTDDEAALALQQLVYTVQAALQSTEPVAVSLDGGDRLLGVDVSAPLERAADAETLAPVWVISPQDSDTVGSEIEVSGVGAFFEATASWQLLRGGEVVDEGFATAEECCVRSPYAFTITGVAPGDYVVRVYDTDMSGGEGGGEVEDTKRVRVE